MKKSILLAFILIGLIHVNASDFIQNIYLNIDNSETGYTTSPIYLAVESNINLDNAEAIIKQDKNNEITIDLRYSKASYRQDYKDYRLGYLAKGDYKLTFTLGQKGSDIIDTTIVLNFKVEDLPSSLICDIPKRWSILDNSGEIYQHGFANKEIEANGQKYSVEYYWDPTLKVHQELYAYREEDGKLYEYSIQDKAERLVFDTNLKTGDKLTLAEGFSIEVEAMSDTMVIYGFDYNYDDDSNDTIRTNCRRWHLRGIENPEYTDTWVEYFGSLKYGLRFPDPKKDSRLMYSHFAFGSTYGDFMYLPTFNLGKYWGFGLQMIEKKQYSGDPAKTSLTYENKNGALHIKGFIRNDSGPLHILMTIENENNIRMSSFAMPPDAEGYSEYYVDFTLPGVFQKENYQISLDGYTIPKTSVALPSISQESAESIWYDLRGRRVTAPESESIPADGIYISKDKKVLILHR